MLGTSLPRAAVRSGGASAGAGTCSRSVPWKTTARLPSSRWWTSTTARAKLSRSTPGSSCSTWPAKRMVLSFATLRVYLQQKRRSRSVPRLSGT